MIIPVWKKIGESTHQLAKEIGEVTALKTNNPEDKKATHTGTLDPMAQGIVLVLTGTDRFRKKEFSDLKKTYEFEILFGVETDSYDLLGIQNAVVSNTENLKNISEKVEKLLPEFIGKQTQTQPAFSAQRVNGKSGFDLAKHNQAFELKKNKIEIYSLQFLSSKDIQVEKILTTLIKKIDSTAGDFRQTEIKEKWKKMTKIFQDTAVRALPVVKIKVTCTKRTYIRSLVKDLSEKLQIPATTFSITRTQIGNFTKKDCL